MAFGVDQVARNAWLNKLMEQVFDHMKWLELKFGFRPLVSVRSGAPILDARHDGHDPERRPDLGQQAGVARSHRASGRRPTASAGLIQMLGATGYGVPMQVFDFQLAKAKKFYGKKSDTDLNADELMMANDTVPEGVRREQGFQLPRSMTGRSSCGSPSRRCSRAGTASGRSSIGKLNKIDDSMGHRRQCAGDGLRHMGDTSGSGVLFTRKPLHRGEVIMPNISPTRRAKTWSPASAPREKLDLTKAEGRRRQEPLEDGAGGDLREAGDALSGHGGRRVHGAEGRLVCPAVPHRQAQRPAPLSRSRPDLWRRA